MSEATGPEWKDRATLEDHFLRHGHEVNARSVEQYEALSLRTIGRGIRFSFFRTGVLRIGYYDVRRHWLVVMQDDDETIISFSRESERQVRTLRGSTYGR